MERKKGTATPKPRRILSVSWMGWSDVSEAVLYRTADGWLARFRVDRQTELSETLSEPRRLGERPWRALATFLGSNSDIRCPGAYIRDISVKGAKGLEAGLLLLAATDDNEDGGGRPLLDALEGLPLQVLETIWRDEGPWVKDGHYTDAQIFETLSIFRSLASEADLESVADCAGDLGIPLEGNVLRSVIDALRAEQEQEERSADEDSEEPDDDEEISYVENVPVTEPGPPRAPAVDHSKVPVLPDRGAIELDCYGHGELAPRQAAPPTGSVFVGSAEVSFELICDTENYWIHPAVDGAGSYQLWGTLDMLSGDSTCCARLEPLGTVTAAEAADTMLRALWGARFAPAVALGNFSSGGLLSLEKLNLIRHDYLRGNWPVDRAPTMQPDQGDLFYAGGALLYRGDLRHGRPHGRGVHYWESGVPWCVGSFRKGEPHGDCRIYFPDGALRYVGKMVDGSPKGRGTEYYDNGRIWFDGIFGQQNDRYGYGARIWIRGRKYDRDGNLVHEGEFTDNGKYSTPLEEEE
jgi:hypothetical protein